MEFVFFGDDVSAPELVPPKRLGNVKASARIKALRGGREVRMESYVAIELPSSPSFALSLDNAELFRPRTEKNSNDFWAKWNCFRADGSPMRPFKEVVVNGRLEAYVDLGHHDFFVTALYDYPINQIAFRYCQFDVYIVQNGCWFLLASYEEKGFNSRNKVRSQVERDFSRAAGLSVAWHGLERQFAEMDEYQGEYARH